MIKSDGRSSTSLWHNSYSGDPAKPQQVSLPVPATTLQNQGPADVVSAVVSHATPNLGTHIGSSSEKLNSEALKPTQRLQGSGFSLRGSAIAERRRSVSDESQSKTTYSSRLSQRLSEVSNTKGSARERIETILSLRKEALENSGRGEKIVPHEETINQLRHARSMPSSLERLRNDPTLQKPPKTFTAPERMGGPARGAPRLAQRPGPETRNNSINSEELGRALAKHGSMRLPKLPPAEEAKAITAMMASPGNKLTAEEAKKQLQSRPLSGGWPRPPDKIPERIARATALNNNILWDARTTEVHEKLGARGYGDPQHNPEGNTILYEGPDGRGVRYSELNKDHMMATSQTSSPQSGAQRSTELRTVRGFTNPEVGTPQSEKAEEQRTRQDRSRAIAQDAVKLWKAMMKNRKNNKK